ncbi:hypothetical protein CK203_019882 [Vitis vinifera]|uniref:Uncharacterized protein n=1 Tax=Vitis vinifera TaxID=29760 RepID=A0A438J332_VITVI|nr:hypothetical protein CK203_019882 [Vitis vinifera]
MKRKNRNRFVDYDEFEVVDILLQIPRIIFEFESRLPLTWGFRRKRSAIDPSLSLAPTCANVSSPTTPLSFFPSESDGKCKRTKEDLLKMVDGSTHQRELLKSEIENVKVLCSTLKALSSKFKERKQQMRRPLAM